MHDRAVYEGTKYFNEYLLRSIEINGKTQKTKLHLCKRKTTVLDKKKEESLVF